MKLGFAKKDIRKEDVTRDQDRSPKALLAGLAVTTALLGGIAYASLKVADIFKRDDEEEENEDF